MLGTKMEPTAMPWHSSSNGLHGYMPFTGFIRPWKIFYLWMHFVRSQKPAGMRKGMDITSLMFVNSRGCSLFRTRISCGAILGWSLHGKSIFIAWHNISTSQSTKHYACVVHVLARAGNLEQVLEFIYKKFKAGAELLFRVLGCKSKSYSDIQEVSAIANHASDATRPDAVSRLEKSKWAGCILS
ncbi:uncharacterized protein LOC120666971 isoform X2 [Panicum virgatum]|uniref:uncharacterized protein LOC120666971 isoform X2 n=1 Tax=Panicum virgatum TaxID=38727 RepID=UPI0019D5FF74|nr:uncharacterized protein LOC120666971 isoform X2 [Panicum virgatum]